MMTKVIIGRFVLTAVFNLLLIVAAYFYPQITLYAYLALPIIDFFFQDKALKRSSSILLELLFVTFSPYQRI